MDWPFDDRGELRDRLIEYKDLSGTTVRECRLNGVRVVGVEMIGGEVDGHLENLVVNGVDVMPLVEAELDRQHPVRKLMRSDDPEALRRAWAELVATWENTIERARTLTEPQRHEQVRGEWSITQTVRHLIFVVDAWFSRAIRRDALPYHPAGLPPELMGGIEEMRIDPEAMPSFDEAVDLWRARSRLVTQFLTAATDDGLGAECERYVGPLWPPVRAGTTVVRCLRVVLNEVWAHHRFATRDLATLDGAATAPR